MVGAVDFVAQLVNEQRSLGIDPNRVDVKSICKKLPATDPLKKTLRMLYKNPRTEPFPKKNPDSDDACIYRVYNYRHQVSHRGVNPLFLQIGAGRDIHLYLDPRNNVIGPSAKTVREDMEKMLNVIEIGCEQVMTLI